ncbi:NADH oxidase [Marinibacterium anthonyi]|nr:NADH oxidase [Marinibacterium anthonyi]
MNISSDPLFRPLALPCGAILTNRLAKAAMSDGLGDGAGAPTDAQARLYGRWATGGLALQIIGEVQVDPLYPEAPGNLVLNSDADAAAFARLAQAGGAGGTHLWPQLGHAGALARTGLGRVAGPSALDLPGLTCDALSEDEIEALPDLFARSARLARDLGFPGVELHAAHGFLFSQFLSPLFNRRTDRWGGSITRRMEILLRTIDAVRAAVGPGFAIGVKINATDQLEGGLTGDEALEVIDAMGRASVDLIDISGGTYFPGAGAASDAGGDGAYFETFARAARGRTGVPLMLTGGIKTRAEALRIVSDGVADMAGLARAVVLDPDLPRHWRDGGPDPAFPRFATRPPGGVTAWYTQTIAAIADNRPSPPPDADAALASVDARDAARAPFWRARFVA